MTTWMLFSEAAFINIFAANIYEGLDEANLPNATVPFTESEHDRIMEHSGWYLFWMLISIAYFAFHWIMYPKLANKSLPLYMQPIIAIGMLALVLGCFSVLKVYLEGIDWASEENAATHNALEVLVMTLHRRLRTALWHWIPIFLFRFLTPKASKVQFTLKLSDDFDNSTVVDPSNVVSWAFRFVAVLTVLGYLTEVESDLETKLAVAAGFRAMPFRYVFVPVWVLITLILGLGAYLSCVRDSMLEANPSSIRILLLKVSSFCMVLSFALCVWIMIPQWNHGYYVVGALFVAIPCFVLSENGFTPKSIGWTVAWVIGAPLAFMFDWMCWVQIALLCVYNYIDTEEKHLMITTDVLSAEGTRAVSKSTELPEV